MQTPAHPSDGEAPSEGLAIGRRTLVGAAAWTVPAIVLSVSSPAMAASQPGVFSIILQGSSVASAGATLVDPTVVVLRDGLPLTSPVQVTIALDPGLVWASTGSAEQRVLTTNAVGELVLTGDDAVLAVDPGQTAIVAVFGEARAALPIQVAETMVLDFLGLGNALIASVGLDGSTSTITATSTGARAHVYFGEIAYFAVTILTATGEPVVHAEVAGAMDAADFAQRLDGVALPAGASIVVEHFEAESRLRRSVGGVVQPASSMVRQVYRALPTGEWTRVPESALQFDNESAVVVVQLTLDSVSTSAPALALNLVPVGAVSAATGSAPALGLAVVDPAGRVLNRIEVAGTDTVAGLEPLQGLGVPSGGILSALHAVPSRRRFYQGDELQPASSSPWKPFAILGRRLHPTAALFTMLGFGDARIASLSLDPDSRSWRVESTNAQAHASSFADLEYVVVSLLDPSTQLIASATVHGRETGRILEETFDGTSAADGQYLVVEHREALWRLVRFEGDTAVPSSSATKQTFRIDGGALTPVADVS